MVSGKFLTILTTMLFLITPVWADPTSALIKPELFKSAPIKSEPVKPETNESLGWGMKPATTASWVQPQTAPVKATPAASTVGISDPKPANKSVETPHIETPRKVVIDIPSRTLLVMEGNRILKKFPVGVGRLGFMTPLGKHQVIRKIENPGWENPYKAAGAVKIRPGANNPLGTRWIGFKEDARGEFGIHGTDSPQSVGKLSSHGCVRMRVPDAEQVFKLVELGTPVEVTYQVVQLSQTPTGDIRITRYPDWFKRGIPTADQVKKLIVQRFGDQATIDDTALSTALTKQSEQPVNVGTITTASKVVTPSVSSAGVTSSDAVMH